MNITYLPIGTRNTASSRLRVYKIADVLSGEGHDVCVTPAICDTAQADVVVVQKRQDFTQNMVNWLDQGKRVIWDVDDWIYYPDLPAGVQVTVDTPYKLELYPNAIVVPDTLDVNRTTPFKTIHAPKMQRVVWVGNPENWDQMRHVIWACEKMKLEIVAITDTRSQHYASYPNITGVQWHLESVDLEIIRSDVMVCPYVFDGSWPMRWVKSKSANRLLKGWALGMPMAGTPIPSYTDAGLEYRATTTDEWIDVLTHYAGIEARVNDALRGYKIAQAYKAESVAKEWLKVFNG
jgi:hypothetical protein